MKRKEQNDAELQLEAINFIYSGKNKYLENFLKKKINKKKVFRKTPYKIISLDAKYFGTRIFGDLMITPQGQIKLCSSLTHVSFGQQSKSESIEFYNDTNCYQIKKTSFSYIPICAAKDALKLINDKEPKQVNFKVLFEQIGERISYINNPENKQQFSYQSFDEKMMNNSIVFNKLVFNISKIIAKIFSK